MFEAKVEGGCGGSVWEAAQLREGMVEEASQPWAEVEVEWPLLGPLRV